MAAPQLTPELSTHTLDLLISDANILSAFPKGSQITRLDRHGCSAWSWPFRMEIALPSGEVTGAFIKFAKGDHSRVMFSGEYESMKMLSAVSPDLAITPISWGVCASAPEMYFFMDKFYDMTDDRPNAAEFSKSIAAMHLASAKAFDMLSQSPRPDMKFGFHVPTCLGKLPQDNRWCATWEALYTQEVKAVLAEEQKTQGHSEELAHLGEQLLSVVIPRLLRPLEIQGHSVRPMLIHNDLQTKNVKIDWTTGRILVFDGGCFWGHNECELGKWRLKRAGFNRLHMEEYHKHIPKSPPEADWGDRIVLYTLRHNLFSSACRPGWAESRRLAMDDMRYLVSKYCT